MAGKGMLAEKSGDWLYLLELDVYYVSLLTHWKLGTSNNDSRREMAVDAYITCIYARHKCALSYRKGVTCATYIYTMLA